MFSKIVPQQSYQYDLKTQVICYMYTLCTIFLTKNYA